MRVKNKNVLLIKQSELLSKDQHRNKYILRNIK